VDIGASASRRNTPKHSHPAMPHDQALDLSPVQPSKPRRARQWPTSNHSGCYLERGDQLLGDLVTVASTHNVTRSHRPIDFVWGFAVRTGDRRGDLARPVVWPFDLNASTTVGTTKSLCHFGSPHPVFAASLAWLTATMFFSRASRSCLATYQSFTSSSISSIKS